MKRIMLAVLLACSHPADEPSLSDAKQIDSWQPSPTVNTEVVLFEDSFLYGNALPPLVYRTEGPVVVSRQPGPDGTMTLMGHGSVIHPAQYRGGTVACRGILYSGSFGLRLGHLGMATADGNSPNPRPGVEVRFSPTETTVVQLGTGAVLATLKNQLITNGDLFDVAATWMSDSDSVAIDINGNRFVVNGANIGYGGFAVSVEDAELSIHRLRATWQDSRQRVFFDGRDSFYSNEGERIATIPSVPTAPGQTYTTISVDLFEGKSLIRYMASDGSFVGYAVRDLEDGAIESLGPTCNGLHLGQGGTSMEGIGLFSSTAPQGLVWWNWNSYRNRQLDLLCFRGELTGHGDLVHDSQFLAYADPAIALDGSIARYIKIDESWQGVTYVTVPPGIANYVNWNHIPLSLPSNSMVSHTGPGSIFSFAVRDKERLFYEEWAYVGRDLTIGGNNLHTRNRGYNLFAGVDDWFGPELPWQKDAGVHSDYANVGIGLTDPGTLYGMMYKWDTSQTSASKIQEVSFDRIVVEDGSFRKIATLPGYMFEVLR